MSRTSSGLKPSARFNHTGSSESSPVASQNGTVTLSSGMNRMIVPDDLIGLDLVL
jgi:hypothetical protein